MADPFDIKPKTEIKPDPAKAKPKAKRSGISVQEFIASAEYDASPLLADWEKEKNKQAKKPEKKIMKRLPPFATPVVIKYLAKKVGSRAPKADFQKAFDDYMTAETSKKKGE